MESSRRSTDKACVTFQEMDTSNDDQSDKENLDTNSDRRKNLGRSFGSRKRVFQSTEPSSTPSVNNTPADKNRATGFQVTALASVVCCSLLCLTRVGTREITIARERFQALALHDQAQWIMDYLTAHSSKADGSYTYTYIVGSSATCLLAWMLTYGIRKTRFYRLKRQVEHGLVRVSPPGHRRLDKMSIAAQEAIGWVHEYAKSYADKLPDRDQLHLPSCVTKNGVFEMYCLDTEAQNKEAVSRSHFYRLWRKHFSHVVIPKVNRFAKCDTCVKIKTSLQETTDKEQRAYFYKRRHNHLTKQNLERQKYYKHSRKATKYPDKYMSVIIDGMDQSKTYVPHFSNVSKVVSAVWKLRTHLTGVIIHGLSPYGFFDIYEWPHSSNLTMNILLNIVNIHKHELPPVLYLQMDNCGRENKNRFVFAFLCLLVERRIFKKIKVSFLMVGHTHEDVDQMFSRFSVWLAKHSALTLDQLFKGFETCYHPTPTSIKLDKVYDICSWLHPFMEDITQHSKPHVFKITLDHSGKAKIQTKDWSTHENWQECEGTANGHLLKSEVHGTPKLLRPSYEKMEYYRLKGGIPSTYRFMAKDEDRQWWKDWLRQMENELETDCEFPSSDEESWSLPKISQAVSSSGTGETLPPIRCPEIESSDEEERFRPVRIGRKDRSRAIQIPENKPLAVGDMCLLDMPRYANNWPQIAMVEEINDDKINIKWLKGSVQSKITPWILIQQGKGKVDWIEEVHRNLIWCHGFSLTGKGYLPTEIRHVIQRYEDTI